MENQPNIIPDQTVTDIIQASFDHIPVYSVIKPYLDVTVFGNTLGQYLIAIIIFLAIWTLLKIFRTIGLKRIEKISKKTKITFDDELIRMIRDVGSFFFVYFSFYLTAKSLNIDETFEKALDGIFIFLIIIEVVRISGTLIDLLFSKSKSAEDVDPTVTNGIRLAASLAIWVIGILMILSNMGFEITALVASLGIGGIAVALAAQNILSDLFSSFAIYFDKPFQIGDFIMVGTDLGVVKKIGLKTTRIQTLQGEELVVSNQELTSARIQNFKKMERRRILFHFGVEYHTPAEKLEKISKIIREIVENEKLADFDRAHFFRFGESSLDYEIVYYVNSSDYAVFMDTQQSINLAIIRALEKEGVSMAFPSRTVYLRKEE